MKYSKLIYALTGLAASAGLSQAAVSIAEGDIILGFSQTTPAGTGVTTNSYIVNLGAGSTFRDYTGDRYTLVNLNADLTSAFGAGWSTDPNIRVGIVGVVPATGSLTNGDPVRTTYVSRAYEGSTGFTMSAAQVGNASTNIGTFRTAMNGIAENGAVVPGGAIVPTATANDFGDFLPPISATYFGNSNALMNAGNVGGTVTGLDVWRTLNTLTGADLTAAQSQGDAALRQGQYIGSFELSNTGAVVFVPEPATGMLTAICGLFGILRRRRA
jgi:hypothetical protein